MDALKFAFEILIVGALALPWLAVLIRIFSSDAASGKPINSLQMFLSVVPEHAQQAVAVAVIVATGYLLGSAVTRVSRNFFNEDKLWGHLPTEDEIRDAVYYEEYCEGRLLSLGNLPFKQGLGTETWLLCAKTKNGTDEDFDELVQHFFRQQESRLLLSGLDKVDRLKQLYDQSTVMRGAALNGIILSALCLFGALGNISARFSGRHRSRAFLFLPAVAVVLIGCYSLWSHWHGKAGTRINHPPLAEFVVLLLGAVGLFVIAKAQRAKAYAPMFAVAAVLTVVSFGGWWWTEIMYDLQVINSLPELRDIAPQANMPPP
jgi:hypothetical protein